MCVHEEDEWAVSQLPHPNGSETNLRTHVSYSVKSSLSRGMQVLFSLVQFVSESGTCLDGFPGCSAARA